MHARGGAVSKRTVTIIGVSGSPRIAATDYAVKAALRYATGEYGAETDYFSLHNRKLNFCIHCDYCRKNKGCVHRDDMTELYSRLEKADAWILGSPVYHGQMSGQLKTFLDRLKAPVAGDPNVFANKAGAGIASGGDRNGGQEMVLQAIVAFYLINKMIPTGGGFFGANFGASIWSRDRGGEGAEADIEGMHSIRKTVDRLMKLSRMLTGTMYSPGNQDNR
jgi:multimeric flavodoxin WrbA